MKYPRLDLGQIEAIVNKLGGMEGVQRFLRGELVVKMRSQEENQPADPVPIPNISDPYLLLLNYGLSWDEWKERAEIADSDWNSDITAKRFPITGDGIAEAKVVLIDFRRAVVTEEVREFRREQGLLPISIEHQLAFAAKHPEIQREFPLVNIDSDWVVSGGNHGVPILREWRDGRLLDLRWVGPDDHWPGLCRFFALCK